MITAHTVVEVSVKTFQLFRTQYYVIKYLDTIFNSFLAKNPKYIH